jgi:hypothetical protein
MARFESFATGAMRCEPLEPGVLAGCKRLEAELGLGVSGAMGFWRFDVLVPAAPAAGPRRELLEGRWDKRCSPGCEAKSKSNMDYGNSKSLVPIYLKRSLSGLLADLFAHVQYNLYIKHTRLFRIFQR